ncbi:MAG: response regulator [Clostridia bacterium]|nr:response regulator [Clostridia bacterium]
MDWVVIVDDDTTNLKIAGHILSKNGIRVTALKNGHALLDYLQEPSHQFPSLILLDINMPGMDGFETLERLRQLEAGKAETPVIFLSADQNQESETRGLKLGATDYIRKPFIPDILLSRVQNTLKTQKIIQQFEKEATTDGLTGFLNKNTTEDRIREICLLEDGYLCVLDLDSFKLINDLCGHDMGDRVLILFSELLKNNIRSEDICGRIGGDEFLIFIKHMNTETELIRLTNRINSDYVDMIAKLNGNQMKLPAGVSIGAVPVPAFGRNYEKLFHYADQALQAVKQRGKHSCAVYGSHQSEIDTGSGAFNLESVTMILEERNIPLSAMWMGREAFINIYRYLVRYMERYHGIAYRVLFTINIKDKSLTKEDCVDLMTRFRTMMQESLRNSDLMVEVSENQLFLLLPETHQTNINIVIDRLMNKWNLSEDSDKAGISWESGRVHQDEDDVPLKEKQADWAVIVSGDSAALSDAENMLQSLHLRMTSMDSGSKLLELLKTGIPDLILLDEELPDMDGIEALRKLKAVSWESKYIPVIFAAENGNQEALRLALELECDDYIQKPFVPELLTHRVRHTLELSRQRKKNREK